MTGESFDKDESSNQCKRLPLITIIKDKASSYLNTEKDTENYYISDFSIKNGTVEKPIYFNKNVRIPFPLIKNIFFLESTKQKLTISYRSRVDENTFIINTLDLITFPALSHLRNLRFKLNPVDADSIQLFSLYYVHINPLFGTVLLIKNINFNESPYFDSMRFSSLADNYFDKNEIQLVQPLSQEPLAVKSPQPPSEKPVSVKPIPPIPQKPVDSKTNSTSLFSKISRLLFTTYTKIGGCLIIAFFIAAYFYKK
jgi:hypothetical protein